MIGNPPRPLRWWRNLWMTRPLRKRKKLLLPKLRSLVVILVQMHCKFFWIFHARVFYDRLSIFDTCRNFQGTYLVENNSLHLIVSNPISSRLSKVKIRPAVARCQSCCQISVRRSTAANHHCLTVKSTNQPDLAPDGHIHRFSHRHKVKFSKWRFIYIKTSAYLWLTSLSLIGFSWHPLHQCRFIVHLFVSERNGRHHVTIPRSMQRHRDRVNRSGSGTSGAWWSLSRNGDNFRNVTRQRVKRSISSDCQKSNDLKCINSIDISAKW